MFQRVRIPVSLLLLALAIGAEPSSADVVPKSLSGESIEAIGNAVIDWNRKVIRVTGFGAANKSFPPQVWRKSAEEAAKVDAQTKLLELVNGLTIKSVTFVKNYQVNLDEKVKEIQGRLKNVTQVGPTSYPTEDTAEVTLELRIE